MKLRFGDLAFDSGRRTLFRGCQPVHLSPKAFQLLELLLAKRPDAVSKAEILASVWPGVFVSEGNLKVVVGDVRKALGENPEGAAWIRTVHGYGYAFDGDVVEAPERTATGAHHTLIWGTREMPLPDGAHILGRESTAPIWVGHPSVSREHARIVVAGERAEIEDLGSKNGMWLGSRRIEGRIELSDGDEIRVGEVHLLYRGPAAGPRSTTKTAR